MPGLLKVFIKALHVIGKSFWQAKIQNLLFQEVLLILEEVFLNL